MALTALLILCCGFVIALRLVLFTRRTITRTRRWAAGARAAPVIRAAPRAAWRPGDTRRYRDAVTAARRLATVITDGGRPEISEPPAGVVPIPGERPLAAVTAGYACPGSITRRRWALPISLLLLRTYQLGGTVTTRHGWADYGRARWLITSHRITGTLPATGETVSISWAAITGLLIDLTRHTIRLGGNGWQAVLHGPGTPVIAVAAVACCYGPRALATHPALAPLRTA